MCYTVKANLPYLPEEKIKRRVNGLHADSLPITLQNMATVGGLPASASGSDMD